VPDWGNRERPSESLTAERLREIEGSQAQINRLWSQQQDRESSPAGPEQRSPEEIVGEVLMSAQRAAEAIIENARKEASRIAAESGRDATPVLSEANRVFEEAKSVYRDAQVTLEQARLQAEALVEAARAERQQLVADSVSAAAQRRAELDAENRRLGQAIHDLRAEWVARAGEALARLDRIARMADSSEDTRELTAITDELDRDRAEAEPDVASDLQSRLSETGSAGSLEVDDSSPYRDPQTPQGPGVSGAPETREGWAGEGAANGDPGVESFGAEPSTGVDRAGLHQVGFDQTGFNQAGLDQTGFGQDGFDEARDPVPGSVASEPAAREPTSDEDEPVWVRRDWDLRDLPRSKPPDAND
jgi:hypothetical protein